MSAVRGRCLAAVAGAAAVIYWALALPFAWSLRDVLDWTPYQWRVPLCALLVIGIPLCMGLVPVVALAGQLRTVYQMINPDSPQGKALEGIAVRARDSAVALSRWVPVLGVLGTMVGLKMGGEPTLKAIAFALGIGLVYGLVLYVAITSTLWPVVAFCNRLTGPVSRGRTSILAKTMACMLIVTIDTVLFQWVAGEPTPMVLLLPVLAAWTLCRPLANLSQQLHGGAVFFSDDEVGEVSLLFGGLRTEVDELQGRLERSRDELLLKVHQRTQDMKEQTALFEVSKAVTSTLHLDRVLSEVVTRTRDLMDANGCALWLRRRDTLELTTSMGLDLPAEMPLHTFSATQYGRPQVLRGDHPGPLAEFMRRQGFSVLVAAPLSSRGHMVGVLCVAYRMAGTVPVDLLMTVGSQAAVAIENARLYERQQYVTHLLRLSLSPREPLGFPGVQVGHSLHPSLELSGDYYDLIPIGPKRFDVVIADVAGKGPDAAIQTARAKNIIAAYATAGLSPGEVLKLLNRQMLAAPEDMHLVTVFYGQADLEANRFVYACAGHEPALMWTSSADAVQLVGDGGIIIGVSEEPHYEEHVVPLEPGTSLLLYTDGVTESRSPLGHFFGVEGLMSVVEAGRELSPQELVTRIYHAVNGYSEGHITDDLSLLAIRVSQ